MKFVQSLYQVGNTEQRLFCDDKYIYKLNLLKIDAWFRHETLKINLFEWVQFLNSPKLYI